MEQVTQRPLAILMLITAFAFLAQAQDGDADLHKEKYFHNIYKKFNEQPTSPEAWEKALAHRRANTYTIQSKDTLWDISQTLFGDSSYWPKVWSYNTEDILNPHQINPNQAIRFYAGSMEEPPTVGVAAKDAPPEALPDEVIEKKEDGSLESIKIPPPKNKSRPLVRHLPDSIPLYRLGAVNTPPIEFEAMPPRHIPTPQKILSMYAVDSDVPNVGEVVETEAADSQSASDYQYITVRLANPSTKNLVAYNDSHFVKDPQSEDKATIIEIQGNIQVLERVNDSDNIYRAFVTKSVAAVKVGAKLMPGSMAMFEVVGGTPVTSVQARIIGGDSQKYQKIFGDDEFIFLSAGSKDGIQEGSTLQVYMNERVRKPSTKTLLNDRVIGTVKVVKVAQHFTTALILRTETDLLIGDYVGGTAKSTGASSSLSPAENASDDIESDFNNSEAAAPPNMETPGEPELNLDTPDGGAEPGTNTDNPGEDLQL
jgi:hypothetical protein